MDRNEWFEDLEIGKEGMRICVRVYELMKEYGGFGLRNRIQRAQVSIPSNIAEGYERQTNNGFVQFLFVAKGSCGELRTQLYLVKELGYIPKEDFKIMMDKSKRLSRMIYSFIKTGKERDSK